MISAAHSTGELQALCERGQQQLMATDYLAAEATLVQAADVAESIDDYDTLGRLYFPLQEARRQRRQVCGEGIIKLDWLATGPDDPPDPAAILDRYPNGQLLVAGWADLGPSLAVRQLAAERKLYVETFLAAIYPVGERVGVGVGVVALVPTADEPLPPADVGRQGGMEALLAQLPAHSILLRTDDLPSGERPGNAETFARTMALWEQLSLPFLNAARARTEPRERIAGYKKAISADYACEKAHQWLAADALELARTRRSAPSGSAGVSGDAGARRP